MSFTQEDLKKLVTPVLISLALLACGFVLIKLATGSLRQAVRQAALPA